MAKFKCEFSDSRGGDLYGQAEFSELSSEDMLSVLRPAAEILRKHYKSVILRLFKKRTGSLSESFQAEEWGLDREYINTNEAVISVGPKGKHKGSMRAARSRAGSSTRKYAKHNRKSKSTGISNAELGYLLEVGTPRIPATHWMENANEEISDTVQQIIEDEFDSLLKRKGL